jgi:hypothetical protein
LQKKWAKLPLLDKLAKLLVLAESKGLSRLWELIMTPWLKQAGLHKKFIDQDVSAVKSVVASEPFVCAIGGGRGKYHSAEGDVPRCPVVQGSLNIAEDEGAVPPAPAVSSAAKPKEITDLVSNLKPGKPWQEQTYSRENMVWQGAAQRRRMHSRRTNVSLGVCSVDLCGPMEPTPRPGSHMSKNPCHYFLVLTVRPDLSAQSCEVACQTSPDDLLRLVSEDSQPSDKPPSKKALYYAALLGTKDEAAKAIQRLLAHINYDHGNYPYELIFRLHSDCGGEFVNKELDHFCTERGIHKTTTAGYDPDANPAESAVGVLTRSEISAQWM